MQEFNFNPLKNDANLKAYYRLENTTDSGPNGYNLTNNNSVTFTTAQFNNGANFSATNSNKALGYAGDMGITGGNITICAWIKLLADISSGSYYMIMQSDNGTDVFYLFHYVYNAGGNLLRVDRTKRGVSNNPVTINTGNLGTSNFNHIALTYDGTTLKGYFNGTQQGGDVTTSGNGSGATAPDSFYIGVGLDNSGAATNYASILADEVIVFNRALTASEVLSIYQGSYGGSFLLNMV